MDELQKLYDVLVREGKYSKSFDEFKSKWSQDQSYKNKVYDVAVRDGLYSKDKDSFFQKYSTPVSPVQKKKFALESSSEDGSLVSPKSPKQTSEKMATLTQKGFEEAMQQEKSVPKDMSGKPLLKPAFKKDDSIVSEEDYFTGSFGNVLRSIDAVAPIGIGDFVDDMARTAVSGYRQGKSDEESFNLAFKGANTSYDEIQKFIDANKNAQQLKPSAELQDYNRIYEEEGKGIWGVIKGFANNPTILPEVILNSAISMATNSDALKAGGAALGAGAARGATAGALATPEFFGAGAIPGAVSGAVSAIPYAFGLASSVVTGSATFGELLQEELQGKEFTKENVKSILENPEKLNSIRNKAIAKGLIVGTVDVLTGKVASSVGAKILSKSAAKSATGAATKGAVTKATAAGAGIESIGGSTGEAASRGAIGQEMDTSDILLEGIAELPGGIRSTIQARLAKPSYKVNGADVAPEELDNIIETMTPEQLASTKIDIKNDYEGRQFKIQDKIITNSIKEQVKQANPELNEASLDAVTELEKSLKSLEGNTTQTGKDKAAALRQQIKNIQENQLTEETDAIQEQSTAEVPVQSETGIIETMEEGISEPKSEISTEQITQEEVTAPQTIIEAIEDRTGAYSYDGKKGAITTIGQTVVLETDNEIIDLGNVDELKDSTLEDFGIIKAEDILLNDDNSVSIGEVKYLNNYSNPDAAISQDKDGNYSITLDTENGQKRTFRGQQADQIVYQMKLKNFEQNGTEQQIEQANELADEAIRIEAEVGTPSAEREGKTVRKAKRKQRTLKTIKEPLTKSERVVNNIPEPQAVSEQVVEAPAPVVEEVAPVETEKIKGGDKLSNNLLNDKQLTFQEAFDLANSELKEIEAEERTLAVQKEYEGKIKEINRIKELAAKAEELSPIQIQESRVESAKSLVKEAKAGPARKKAMQDLNREEGRLAEIKAFERVKSKEAPVKKESKFDKQISELEKDLDYYTNQVENIEDEIRTEKENTKEETQRIKEEIAKVKSDTSLNREEKSDRVEDLKAELEDLKNDQDDLIENYKEDLKEAKSELKKTERKLAKLLSQKENDVNELLDLDTKDKGSLKRVLDFLDRADEALNLDPNELNDVTRVMAIATAKAIVKTLKALVNAGITLQEAINNVSEIYEITSDKIIDALDIVSKINENVSEGISEMEAPGYNQLSKDIDNMIANDSDLNEVLDSVKDSDVYKNATDVQRELLVRDVRKRFGLRQKQAPSVGKIFGTIKDIKKITMREKDLLIKQIRDKIRGAKDAIKTQKEISQQLIKEIKELETSGRITSAQALNMISKFGKVNLLNEASVSSFFDYMTKVFADAEYDNKINIAKKKLANAKRNIATKIGMADGLMLPLQKLFSINPTLIPQQYLSRYLELVNMFGERKEVLSLEEKSVVTEDVQEILDEINNEQSLSDELADRFEASDNKVFKDGVLDYSASVKNMLEEGEIDSKEASLMSKYKNRIVDSVERTKMTEEEIKKEKNVLANLIKKSTVDPSSLSTRDEVNLAKRLARLIKGDGIKELSNTELKNVLKLIDNINNGYLPHYTQLMVEKLTSINNSKPLESAVKKSTYPKFTYMYSKMKSIFTKKDEVFEMIRRNPLFYIDQVLGNFKTKDIFNSVLEMVSEGEAKFTSEFKSVKERLVKAQYNVAKSFTLNDKLNPNKVLESSFKMMTYAIQLEYESNKDSKQVNPASEFIKATIKHINDGKSQFGERDAEVLQKILKDYSTDGQIDIDKLYSSFNNAEKNAIKTVREINESLTEKSEYTASVIRGQKINPLTNYIHLNVLHEHQPNDLASGTSFADNYNNSLRPSTKAKSLIERTGKVSPLNFDMFTSAERGAKFVLMDYHLTEPIRTARKTINKTISNLEKDGDMSKKDRKVINAINSAYEESISNLVSNTYEETSLGDDIVDEINRQGYRAVLAGTGRFGAELLSNVGFILMSDPNTFTEGLKNISMIMSPDAPKVMNNVNSKETNRIFPSDMLSGALIDTSILNQSIGTKGAVSKNDFVNRVQQIWNLTGKKYKNAVELNADSLMSIPDKVVMRPIWFGSFANQFEKMTGKKVDFKKIADNDSDYMEENREAIDEAKKIADERSVITGGSSNAFTGILKGASKPNQKATVKGFNMFNNFMSKFLIYEFATARTGINAAMGNGSLTRRQGVALLAAVTTRMTVYSLLMKSFGSGLIGLLFDDDEEEKEKSADKMVGQALASTFTSLLLGRDFGNLTKGFINEGVEKMNEEYLDFLRDGDYDPYKDAIQYRIIDKEKTNVSDLVLKLGGPFGPAINTADLVLRKSFEPKKKERAAIERQEKEIKTRIPLEILGNTGFIPFYKDVRKVVLKDMYKDLEDKEVKRRIVKRT
jgi:hypothetical protein